jgi:hypothetical protein
MKQANCLNEAPNVRNDPDAKDPWFPGKGHSLNTGKMKCFTCSVRAECKGYRRRTGSTHGMWGGEIVSSDEEE